MDKGLRVFDIGATTRKQQYSPKVKPWKELSRERIFCEYGRGIDKVAFHLPNGKIIDYYLKQEGECVCTLAITKDQQVILARQYRPGPGEILDDLPGGGIEKGESPKKAALRELLEETGYSGQAKLLGRNYYCAYSNSYRWCFVVTDCEKVQEPRADGNEFVEVCLVSIDEFREILRSGKITDATTGYLGLDMLGLL